MDDLCVYCPIRITHPTDGTVFGEITSFFAVDTNIAFSLCMSNGVVVYLQPSSPEYPIMVQHALLRGGYRAVHPNTPVMTVGGRCIRLRAFFGLHPFTRSNFQRGGGPCGIGDSLGVSWPPLHGVHAFSASPAGDAECVRVVDVQSDTLGGSVGGPVEESCHATRRLRMALVSFSDAILENAAEGLRMRDERIHHLRVERDRLKTWVVPDVRSMLCFVLLRPVAPAVQALEWTSVGGILLPALEEYARLCTGRHTLVLRGAQVYSDVVREQAFIDACSELCGSVTNVARAWPCGDGQYLMWRGDTSVHVWEQEPVVSARPTTAGRRGVCVSVCPPVGAKSAILVRVALGWCARSPSSASAAHHSAACSDVAYAVFDARRVVPAFRVVFC